MEYLDRVEVESRTRSRQSTGVAAAVAVAIIGRDLRYGVGGGSPVTTAGCDRTKTRFRS